MTRNPDIDRWIAEARGRDVLAAAGKMGAKLKRQGAEHVGPCPVCGAHDTFAVRPRKGVFVCRRGGAGGSAIDMAMHVMGLDFMAACEWLNGAPPPGRVASMDVANAEPPAPRDTKADDEAEAVYRAAAIRKARGIWEAGQVAAGSDVQAYLAARGLTWSDAWPLRCAPSQPYWHDTGPRDVEVLHRGPAMLAPVTGPDGVVTGCHITWIDPKRPGKKIALPDPAHEGKFLKAKKLRGSKRKGAIKLITPKDFTRLVIGEGIETTLSLYECERQMMRAGSAYWAGIDLGQIGGRAARQVSHPTLKTDKGNPRRVGGPEPKPEPDRDLDLPDCVTEVLLLGDGDSDRLTTENALTRAAARWDAPGRTIRVLFADDGLDFNDMLMGATG